MALFVQIDHFRKTDQKPTVKNHLFSISWFRSFNRTSFQQQLKRLLGLVSCALSWALQSYILSTTTETIQRWWSWGIDSASIVHPFNNNWNDIRKDRIFSVIQASIVHPFNNNWNLPSDSCYLVRRSFNRTSFQQQLKHGATLVTLPSLSSFNRTSFQQQLKRVPIAIGSCAALSASIVHPFNNNWNIRPFNAHRFFYSFNRTSFQQQLKQ